MKVHNVRFGFATNSSSSHSIIVLRPGHTVDELANDDGGRAGAYEFGWEIFRLTEVEEKTRYVVAQFVSNVRMSGLDFPAIQKLIEDIFGVHISRSEYGSDLKWPDISIDHQSALSVPSEEIDFWRGFHKYVQRPDIVILGGNDNGGEPEDDYVPIPHDKVEWFDEIVDRGRKTFRIRYDNGRVVFFNSTNGTKTRISFDSNEEYTKASTPELVDLHITSYCPFGCSFCYQSSTKKGIHADKKQIFKIIRQLKKLGVFEIAIGGGEPTMHPDFAEILRYTRKQGIIPNFTTFSTAWLADQTILTAVADTVGGIGVSIHNLKDLNKFRKIQTTVLAKSARRLNTPKTMAQHVLGSLPVTETAELFKTCIDNYIPLLVLGYKDVGFGSRVAPEDHASFPTILKLILEDADKWCQISVDTAILQQFPDLLKVLDVSPVLATSEEGKFSCYIDAVNGQMGPSSYCPGQMGPLPPTYLGIKKLFQAY